MDSGEPRERIILDGIIYRPVSSIAASREHRSQVSIYNDNELRLMKPYQYQRLLSMHKRLRLLCLHGGGLFNPEITGELVEVEFDISDHNRVRKTLDREDGIRRERQYFRPQEVGREAVEYEALSWCWGQGAKNHAIKIQQGGSYYRLAVTKELILALKYLRHPHEERMLWIDALCIDQSNYEERNHQVQMMSRIYSGAKQVCVWLGEDTDDSATAIAFIHEIMGFEDLDTMSGRKESASKWHSLLLLMQRPWFSRRWVVQEIALARSATIYCGNDKIPWTSFAIAVELLVEIETATHRLSEVMKKDVNVPQWFEHISELGASVLVQATGKVFRRDGGQGKELDRDLSTRNRQQGHRHKRKALKSMHGNSNRVESLRSSAVVSQRPLLSLEYLVSSLCGFQTSQPRDAVYALLAIARDTSPMAGTQNALQEGSEEAIIMSTVSKYLGQTPFRIDYSRAYSDVCKDFISCCLEISRTTDPTRALDILCRPWAPDPETTVGVVNHRKPTLYKFLPSDKRERLWPIGRKRRPTFRIFPEYHSMDIYHRPPEPQPPVGSGTPVVLESDTRDNNETGRPIVSGAPMLRRSDKRDKATYWGDCEDDWRNNFKDRVLSFERDVKPYLPMKRKPPKNSEGWGQENSVIEDSESGEEWEGSKDEKQDEQEEDIPLPSWVSCISGAPFALYRHPGMHKLGRVGRVRADPLVGLPQDGRKNYSAAQNTKVDYDSDRRLRFRKRPMLNHCSLFTEGFVLTEVDTVAEPARLGAIPETWTKVAGWENAIDGQTDPPVEFWRTLVADRGKDERNPPYYYATACRESVRKGGLRGGSVDTGALINSESNSIIAEFCRRVQAVIWNRCLIKTDAPLNVLGLTSQHVRKGDLVCIIFGCAVPVILRKFVKTEGDLEREKMQDQIESMKAAMAVCEEACFRKLRYQKRLQKEQGKGEHFGEMWKEEIVEEMKDVNYQIKMWRERIEEDKKRNEAQGIEREIRKKNAELRQALAKKKREVASPQFLKNRLRTITMPTLRSGTLLTSSASTLVNGGITEDPKETVDTSSVPLQGHGQDRRDGASEASQRTPDQLEDERQRGKEEAKEEDPNVYYQFMGEAYIHGMMDGEAVRLHINEAIPRRMFEIR